MSGQELFPEEIFTPRNNAHKDHWIHKSEYDFPQELREAHIQHGFNGKCLICNLDIARDLYYNLVTYEVNIKSARHSVELQKKTLDAFIRDIQTLVGAGQLLAAQEKGNSLQHVISLLSQYESKRVLLERDYNVWKVQNKSSMLKQLQEYLTKHPQDIEQYHYRMRMD